MALGAVYAPAGASDGAGATSAAAAAVRGETAAAAAAAARTARWLVLCTRGAGSRTGSIEGVCLCEQHGSSDGGSDSFGAAAAPVTDAGPWLAGDGSSDTDAPNRCCGCCRCCCCSCHCQRCKIAVRLPSVPGCCRCDSRSLPAHPRCPGGGGISSCSPIANECESARPKPATLAGGPPHAPPLPQGPPRETSLGGGALPPHATPHSTRSCSSRPPPHSPPTTGGRPTRPRQGGGGGAEAPQTA